MKHIIIILLVVAAVFSCKKTGEDLADTGKSRLLLRGSFSEYSDLAGDSVSAGGDPFDLREVIVTEDSVFIKVSYGGGCERHEFEIIWSETFSNTTPPGTGFIIIHHANGDMCEAYITEILAFAIKDLTTTVSFDTLYVGIVNGTTPSDSISSGGWVWPDTTIVDDGDYEIKIPEGDTCQIAVTAARAICGAGLWDNLWFALEDSVSTGGEYYFSKYLQPVAIEKNLEGFVPVQGKKYIVGVVKQEEHGYMDVPVCMAYSGPSVPVKITCITIPE